MPAPIIAFSHGGGPMPLLGDPAHENITSSLRTRVPALLGLDGPNPPRAIILVTAHWRTPSPRISSAEVHPLLYDYYNFPPAAYSLTYPARGEPSVAKEIAQALRQAGLEAELDPERGWDHGVFVPMLLIDPEGRVPIVQLSVLEDDDPERHLRMGEALSRLREEHDVAIVGSGFASLHSFPAFSALARGGDEGRLWSGKVDEWNAALGGVVRSGSKGERRKGLAAWRELPHAMDVHPEGAAEHFMPLVVCAGAAGEGEAAGVYADEYKGAQMLTFYWQ